MAIRYNTIESLQKQGLRQISESIFEKKGNFGQKLYIVKCDSCKRWQVNPAKQEEGTSRIIKICDFEPDTRIQFELPRKGPRIISKPEPQGLAVNWNV